jgi:cob(I)alamin adenosyltransferase
MKRTPAPPSQASHRRKMQALQAKMRKKIRAAQEKRDLVIVHTGNGKGKSTAGFGLLARMLGHGRRCAVVQFIKSDGFTWDTQNRAADVARCREGWAIACAYLRQPEVKLLVLDELNIALSFDYLPAGEVIAALRARAPGKHVVITGRGAPDLLIAAADLVTEMREIKHPFNEGVKAQAGIEF